MAAITAANVTNAIVKLVASEALAPLRANMVMGNLVNRNFEPMLANGGDTINVPIPGAMTANTMAFDAGTVTSQNPNLGNAQIVLNKHIEATFVIPDVYKALAFPGLLMSYMEPAIIAVAEKIEADLLGIYASFTTNAALGTGGTLLTEAVLDNAETALFNAKTPANAEKYLVVDGGNYGALRQITRFSEYRTAKDAGIQALIDGNIGKLKNLFVFRSQLLAVTGAGPFTQHCLAFSKDSMGLVIRRLPMPLPGTGAIAEYIEDSGFGLRVTMSYQPNTLAQQFTIDALYGVGVLRNAFGQQVNA